MQLSLSNMKHVKGTDTFVCFLSFSCLYFLYQYRLNILQRTQLICFVDIERTRCEVKRATFMET